MQIQPILGYFWAIFGLYQPPGPPLLDLGLPFLHILDPPLDRPTMNKREARVLEARESAGGKRTSAEGASLLPEAQRRN